MITTIVVGLLLLVGGTYGVAVLEEWIMRRRLRVAAPLKAGLALLGRESFLPRQADRIFFVMAPGLLLVAAVGAFMVLPFAPDGIIVDLATGALFVNAALAYVMVALVMAGWGPDSVYAMIGGWRFLAQLIAYAMLIVMPLTATAMRAQSLNVSAIVRAQAELWNALAQPLGFGLFWLAAMMVCFVPPFDLPIASGELAGGVEGEYSGVRLATFRLARQVLIFTLALCVTVFYLGGWAGPFGLGWAWTLLKTWLVAGAMLGIGRYLPRLREEDLIGWCWKLGVPLALINILWVGVTLLVVR